MNSSGLKYKANYYLLLLIAFIIPLKKELAAPLIVLFFISSLFNIKKREALIKNWKALIPLSLFLVYALTLFYTENRINGWEKLETKLSLFAFPIILYLSNINYRQKMPRILLSFIEGCLLSTILGLIHAISVSLLSGSLDPLFYNSLNLYHHTSYAGMFLCIALAIVYYYALKPNKALILPQYVNFILILLFSIFIGLLLSRTAIIIMVGIHFLALGYWIFKLGKTKLGILGLMGLLLGAGSIYLSSSKTQNRINELFVTSSDSNTSSGLRKQIWSISVDLAKTSPIIGYGEGDVEYQLSEQYRLLRHRFLTNRYLNAHNQYLQTLLSSGILGLFIFLFFFYSLGMKLYQQREFLALFIVLILLFNFFTESMLETQSGTVVTGFFVSLIWIAFSLRPNQSPLKTLNSPDGKK